VNGIEMNEEMILRVPKEERMMIEQFGDEYRE